MGSGEHKLALFADDILIYMCEPSKSLPVLFNFLERYEAISGYKLNVTKTQVITFNYKPPRQLKEKYNLKWDTESIQYLGVNLPADQSKTYSLNYGPLNKKLKSDLLRWSLNSLYSLSSKVDSVRMIILPKLFYLFQTLPVEIANQQFSEWNKLISRFLWQGKKTRVRFKTLQLSKEKAGLGLPCLQQYYYVAQLRPLVCWSSPTYSAKWIEIEKGIMEEPPLSALIADCKLRIKINKEANPWINLLFKIWQQTKKYVVCKMHQEY